MLVFLPREARNSRSKVRLVVVDDDPPYRRLLSIMFGRRGDLDIVAEAADGEKAISIIRSAKPDVVLLDERMPVMSGLEAVPAIRRAYPKTKIVMHTSHGSPDFQANAKAAGADAYLPKDSDIQAFGDAIVELVRGATRGSRSRGPAARSKSAAKP